MRAGPAAPAWTLQLSGRAALVGAERGTLTLERRDGLMLAYLAIEGPTSREKLMSLLWPDESTAVIRNRLRQRLFVLKRKLGVEAVAGNVTLTLGAALRWDGLSAHGTDKSLLADESFEDFPELAQWVTALRERQATLHPDQLAQQAATLEREGRWVEAIVLAN